MTMMRPPFLFVIIAALVNNVVHGQLSRQECIDEGGIVVGDIGNGAIFAPTYVCDSNGLPPIDVVVAGPDEPIATDGEVCCGGGDGSPVTEELSEDDCIAFGGVVMEDGTSECADQQVPLGTIVADPARQGSTTNVLCCSAPGDDVPFPPPDTTITDRMEYTRQECLDNNGTIVGDIGNGAIFQEDYICESNGLPPIANILQTDPPFAIEGEVCCGIVDEDDIIEDPFPPPSEVAADREEYTRQECLDNNGTIVGDIGNGAIFQEDYICESNGLPPIANIVQDEPPFAIEGEVCCGVPVESEFPSEEEMEDQVELSRQECTDSLGGIVVGDIGDGATRRDDYLCSSNGQPILGIIVTFPEESIAKEGEVCCGGNPNAATSTTPSPIDPSTADPTSTFNLEDDSTAPRTSLCTSLFGLVATLMCLAAAVAV